jgi:hypothetical protein
MKLTTTQWVLCSPNRAADDIARGVLTDALIALANVFEEAGLNPPKKIEVDRPPFDKLLSESITLYRCLPCNKEFNDMQITKEHIESTGHELMERQLGIDK